MIDTHCHLLPALDDGPRNMAQSVALARQLRTAGVHTVICTPHYSRRFPTAHLTARQRLTELREVLSATGLPLKLGLAAEISAATALEADADDLTKRALGNGHLLVELEPDTPAGFVSVLLERLRERGQLPVFAHPERCRAVRSQPRILDSARERGAQVQIVASSLVGKWGRETVAAAWQLLGSGRVDIIGSDSHGPRPGGLHLPVALDLVATRLGAGAVRELTEDRPAQLIAKRPAAR